MDDYKKTMMVNNSLRANPNGDMPEVDSTAYVEPSAQIIGKVRIGAEVYVGPNAVIRADESDGGGEVEPIEIGAQCNIQDGVIIHALVGTKVTIGRRTSLAHGCIVHGPCTLGNGCFVGFGAVVYNAALADGVFLGAGCVVQGVDLGLNSCVRPRDAILSGPIFSPLR